MLWRLRSPLTWLYYRGRPQQTGFTVLTKLICLLFETHLELGSNTSTIIRVTLGEHLDTACADEISSPTDMAGYVAGETVSLFLAKHLVVEYASLNVCACA